MIILRPISDEDIVEIQAWPSYGEGFEQMDYALREQGWLDKFRDRPDTWIYIAEADKRVIGFSLLSRTAVKNAEFRIALHPHRTGKRFGRKMTIQTLETGFRQLGMEQIHLIVRKNNPRALKLYRSIGFVVTGESSHAIQGRKIDFIDMNMTGERFNNLRIEETK